LPKPEEEAKNHGYNQHQLLDGASLQKEWDGTMKNLDVRNSSIIANNT
jgi:hypothetical protein